MSEAEVVFNNRLCDIGALLDQIGQEVGMQKEEFPKNPDWGLVGDVGRCRDNLVQALEAISGLEKSDIEETLSEIRDQAFPEEPLYETIDWCTGKPR